MLRSDLNESRLKVLQWQHKKNLLVLHRSEDVCGIYAILNKVNGKIYIGQTTTKITEYLRKNRLFKLREGSMHNKRLQYDFTKYKEESFEFFILEKFPIPKLDNTIQIGISEENLKMHLISTLNYLEVYYINIFNTLNNDYGYNVELGGENTVTKEEVELIVEEGLKKRQELRDTWVYGDFADSKILPFKIPNKFIPQKKIKCPDIGLGSIVGLFIKNDQNVDSYEQFLNEFYHQYGEREYVIRNHEIIPYFIAQQIMKKFPETEIIY